MMMAIKQEDELREKLHRENQASTKSQLDKQVEYKKKITEDQLERIHKSFGDAFPPYLEDKERNLNLEVAKQPRKRFTLSLFNKSAIKDDLQRQIADNELRKKQAREADLNYGQRLNLMARNMQKKDAERMALQREH